MFRELSEMLLGVPRKGLLEFESLVVICKAVSNRRLIVAPKPKMGL